MKYLRLRSDGSVFSWNESMAHIADADTFECDPSRIPEAGIPDLAAFLAEDKPPVTKRAPRKAAE